MASEVSEKEGGGVHGNHGRANKVEGIVTVISPQLLKVTEKQPHI